MRYADFVARLTGLAVAAAGAALAGWGMVTPAVAGIIVGAAFVLGGLAVVAGRGRAVAISAGSGVVVAVVVALVTGLGAEAGGGRGVPLGLLAVGGVALVLLLSGASIRGGGQAGQ